MPSKSVSTRTADAGLYGGEDARELARYTYGEAARATGVPATTIAAWVRGQEYARKHGKGFFEPLIHRPQAKGLLSFNNLIEVHVLRSIRVRHKTKLQKVRDALAVAQMQFNIRRLLINKQLRFDAGGLFLETITEMLSLNNLEQITMRDMLYECLDRIEYGSDDLPKDFFPITRSISNTGRKLILVSPFRSFGKPIVGRVGVSTHAIAERVLAGESVASIIADYRLEEAEFHEALRYESAA